LAEEHDLVLKALARPGYFVIEGQPLLLAWPAERVSRKIVGSIQFTFAVGRRRTSTQDVEYALDQLVEVGLRALSTAINDPFTAMSCIDWVCAGVYRLTQREGPSAYRLNEQGRLRVVAEVSTFEGIVNQAFNQLRQHSHGDVAVTCRLLEGLGWVAETCTDGERKKILRRHIELIYQGSMDVPVEEDRKDVEERYLKALRLLEEERGSGGVD
jgi:uncharacterized membrane protein